MARKGQLELLSASEVATLLGVDRKTVNAYHSRGRLPAPVAVLAVGPIWLKTDIERWARARPRKGQQEESPAG